ncbi:hypothetical protein COCOBI_18-1090 [Coccomyxa sp. Obi]|nr:hypothetical protein COCOBI_18-1090 [Coccomyxa sp. Obi]
MWSFIKALFRAARDFAVSLPWPKLLPTELDVEIWRHLARLRHLNREISAIEDEIGIYFNPECENYKNILGVVEEEEELCRCVDLDCGLRRISFQIIRGHYLQKEIERQTEDLEELLALRESGGDY